MEKLGLGLGYVFNEYLRGPYSPALTMDYYNNSDRIKELKTEHKLRENELRIAENMKTIVELGPGELEALSFILLKGWLCDSDALVNVSFYKPHLTVEEVKRAIEIGREVFKCE